MDIHEFAKKGAAARWAKATPEERKAHGKMLADARKEKKGRCNQCRLENNTGICDRRDCIGYDDNTGKEANQ